MPNDLRVNILRLTYTQTQILTIGPRPDAKSRRTSIQTGMIAMIVVGREFRLTVRQ